MTQSRTPATRRRFIAGTALAAPALLGSSTTARAAAPAKPLPKGAVILFQGDSITDAGRNKGHAGPNNLQALGRGYPSMIAPALLRDHPALDLKILNRGISGHKVPQLDARWQKDTVDLKPALVSILIGVNDIWHMLNGKYDGTTEIYESGYRALVARTLKEVPGVRVVICEPFVLRCGAVKDNWFPEMDHRRAAAKKVADEFDLTFVPFQSMFDKALAQAPAPYWARDGVHPSLAGHSLMAKTWRETVGI